MNEILMRKVRSDIEWWLSFESGSLFPCFSPDVNELKWHECPIML